MHISPIIIELSFIVISSIVFLHAMTVVTPGSKILVTGGSGFLGMWIIKYLLEQGFSVRATVRSPSKAEGVKKVFSEYIDRLEFAYVPDVVAPGAFDEAVQGDISGIVHCASPLVPADPKAEPSVTITPAIEGTVGILKSAQSSISVKRVVITASIACVVDTPKPPGYAYSETDWNHAVVKQVETLGREAAPFTKYSASKMHAELAAWEWLKGNEVSYDVVFLLPSLLFGPALGETNKEFKGTSNFAMLSQLKLSHLKDLTPEKLKAPSDFNDVRETAERHVKALVTPEAAGERILSVAYVSPLQDLLEILQKNPVEGITIPKFEKQEATAPFSYSQDKSNRILGVPNKPVEETLTDLLKYALSIGWTQ